jgi:signal peptidase I
MTRWRFLGRVRLVALSLGGAVLLLLTVRSSVASLHRAHGSSDAPTIRDGDVLLVNRMAYDVRLPVGGIATRGTSVPCLAARSKVG